MDDRMDCCGGSRETCNNMDCMIERKVFSACSKRKCFEDMHFKFLLPHGTLDDFTFVDVAFGKAKVVRMDGYPYFTPKNDCVSHFRGIVLVPVFAYLKERCSKKTIMVPLLPIEHGNVCPDNFLRVPFDHRVELKKKFVLQGRYEPYAESFGQFCENITLEGCTLRMSVGLFVIIKVIGDTQLKMSHHGFCDVPPECPEEGCANFCENFLDKDITTFPRFFQR